MTMGGQELTNWYALLQKAAIAGVGQAQAGTPRKSSLTMAKLPPECSSVLTAGGFDPPPFNEDSVPEPVLKALASKEAGPLPPRLDAAGLKALIAARAEVSLPERNPNR